jgi:tRNA-specific 2-thiouridylase
MSKKVFVGLSGGVDSSVTAALLKQQGYAVTGVYMKNWSRDLPGHPCPWKEDYQDAKRVAVQLGIDFLLFDFEKEYQDKVVDYMIEEYQAGRTPNPDIMCNQEVKFKLFLHVALDKGADMIATGHYARVKNSENSKFEIRNSKLGQLHMAKDANKDQTYFLYRVTSEALDKTLFPLGEYTKPEVRQLAKQFGLLTATKKESMGICFVGKVGIKDFLSQYVVAAPGAIVDQYGRVIGKHSGAIFYTIGQRHGLDVGGGLPYYVIGKDMTKNEVYVSTDINDPALWTSSLNLTDMHWINGAPQGEQVVQVRTRHRAPLVEATLQVGSGGAAGSTSTLQVALSSEIKSPAPGQSTVIYQDGQVLGGGIVI